MLITRSIRISRNMTFYNQVINNSLLWFGLKCIILLENKKSVLVLSFAKKSEKEAKKLGKNG